MVSSNGYPIEQHLHTGLFVFAIRDSTIGLVSTTFDLCVGILYNMSWFCLVTYRFFYLLFWYSKWLLDWLVSISIWDFFYLSRVGNIVGKIDMVRLVSDLCGFSFSQKREKYPPIFPTFGNIF